MTRHSCALLIIATSALFVSANPARVAASEMATSKSWVFFADKGFSKDSEKRAALAELAETYNARAVKRRTLRRTAPGLFDKHDLPLVESYVDAVTATGASICVRSRWLNAVSVRATAGQLRAIESIPSVRSTQSVRRSKPLPQIPQSTSQNRPGGDFYGVAEQQLAQIGVADMHTQGYTGAGVVIGVLDTGFHREHVAFNESGHELQVIAEWDFVNDDPETGIESGDPTNQHDHGTYILGTMGAYRPDEMVGGAYGASFILAKAEDVGSEYPLEEDWFAAGLEFIEANGGDVATSSLVAYWYTQDAMDGETAVMTQAFNIATANGLHCCQAAGNEGHDSDPATAHLIIPADAYDVISVGAVDVAGRTASFSSDGPTQDGRVKPEVMARGQSTWTVSATSETGYTQVSGTSAAAPLVASAVACIVEAHPDWSVATMRQRLMETADYYLEFKTYDPFYTRGYGIVDAALAADEPSTTEPGPVSTTANWSRIHPNPTNATTRLSYSLDRPGELRFELFDLQGRRVRFRDLGYRGAGIHQIEVAPGTLASGLYQYRLLTNGSVLTTGRLLLNR